MDFFYLIAILEKIFGTEQKDQANLTKQFLLTDIKSRFTCGKSHAYEKCYIVSRCLFPGLVLLLSIAVKLNTCERKQ